MLSNLAGALVFVTIAASSAQGTFWSWFQSNEADFPTSETFDETFGDDLTRHLQAIHPDLTWETMSPDQGQKELIISADGLRDLIPLVEELVQSAPELTGWVVTAFRPRLDNYAEFVLNCGDREFNPNEIWFVEDIKDGHFDIVQFHPGYSGEDHVLIVHGTYLLLDMALGEYDVMTGIRHIDHQPLPGFPETRGLKRFSELRAVFDRHKPN